MADLGTVQTALETAIDALAVGLSRLAGSDYRKDLDDVPIGTSRYQLRAQYENDEGIRSDVIFKGASFVVELHHHLGAAEAEDAYTGAGEFVTLQATLLGVAFWEAIAGIRRVRSGPDLAVDVVRNGNVLSFGVGVVVTMDN